MKPVAESTSSSIFPRNRSSPLSPRFRVNPSFRCHRRCGRRRMTATHPHYQQTRVFPEEPLAPSLPCPSWVSPKRYAMSAGFSTTPTPSPFLPPLSPPYQPPPSAVPYSPCSQSYHPRRPAFNSSAFSSPTGFPSSNANGGISTTSSSDVFASLSSATLTQSSSFPPPCLPCRPSSSCSTTSSTNGDSCEVLPPSSASAGFISPAFLPQKKPRGRPPKARARRPLTKQGDYPFNFASPPLSLSASSSSSYSSITSAAPSTTSCSSSSILAESNSENVNLHVPEDTFLFPQFPQPPPSSAVTCINRPFVLESPSFTPSNPSSTSSSFSTPSSSLHSTKAFPPTSTVVTKILLSSQLRGKPEAAVTEAKHPKIVSTGQRSTNSSTNTPIIWEGRNSSNSPPSSPINCGKECKSEKKDPLTLSSSPITLFQPFVQDDLETTRSSTILSTAGSNPIPTMTTFSTTTTTPTSATNPSVTRASTSTTTANISVGPQALFQPAAPTAAPSASTLRHKLKTSDEKFCSNNSTTKNENSGEIRASRKRRASEMRTPPSSVRPPPSSVGPTTKTTTIALHAQNDLSFLNSSHPHLNIETGILPTVVAAAASQSLSYHEGHVQTNTVQTPPLPPPFASSISPLFVVPPLPPEDPSLLQNILLPTPLPPLQEEEAWRDICHQVLSCISVTRSDECKETTHLKAGEVGDSEPKTSHRSDLPSVKDEGKKEYSINGAHEKEIETDRRHRYIQESRKEGWNAYGTAEASYPTMEIKYRNRDDRTGTASKHSSCTPPSMITEVQDVEVLLSEGVALSRSQSNRRVCGSSSSSSTTTSGSCSTRGSRSSSRSPSAKETRCHYSYSRGSSPSPESKRKRAGHNDDPEEAMSLIAHGDKPKHIIQCPSQNQELLVEVLLECGVQLYFHCIKGGLASRQLDGRSAEKLIQHMSEAMKREIVLFYAKCVDSHHVDKCSSCLNFLRTPPVVSTTECRRRRLRRKRPDSTNPFTSANNLDWNSESSSVVVIGGCSDWSRFCSSTTSILNCSDFVRVSNKHGREKIISPSATNKEKSVRLSSDIRKQRKTDVSFTREKQTLDTSNEFVRSLSSSSYLSLVSSSSCSSSFLAPPSSSLFAPTSSSSFSPMFCSNDSSFLDDIQQHYYHPTLTTTTVTADENTLVGVGSSPFSSPTTPAPSWWMSATGDTSSRTPFCLQDVLTVSDFLSTLPLSSNNREENKRERNNTEDTDSPVSVVEQKEDFEVFYSRGRPLQPSLENRQSTRIQTTLATSSSPLMSDLNNPLLPITTVSTSKLISSSSSSLSPLLSTSVLSSISPAALSSPSSMSSSSMSLSLETPFHTSTSLPLAKSPVTVSSHLPQKQQHQTNLFTIALSNIATPHPGGSNNDSDEGGHTNTDDKNTRNSDGFSKENSYYDPIQKNTFLVDSKDGNSPYSSCTIGTSHEVSSSPLPLFHPITVTTTSRAQIKANSLKNKTLHPFIPYEPGDASRVAFRQNLTTLSSQTTRDSTEEDYGGTHNFSPIIITNRHTTKNTNMIIDNSANSNRSSHSETGSLTQSRNNDRNDKSSQLQDSNISSDIICSSGNRHYTNPMINTLTADRTKFNHSNNRTISKPEIRETASCETCSIHTKSDDVLSKNKKYPSNQKNHVVGSTRLPPFQSEGNAHDDQRFSPVARRCPPQGLSCPFFLSINHVDDDEEESEDAEQKQEGVSTKEDGEDWERELSLVPALRNNPSFWLKETQRIQQRGESETTRKEMMINW